MARAPTIARILLVDDHPLVRHGMKALLESSPGFAVPYEADDGEEAIAIAKHSKPDVIVMDVTMHGMNGIEATEEIHRLEPQIPILMLSMYADRAFVEAAREAGAQGYVTKDEADMTLIEAVNAVLNHHQFFPMLDAYKPVRSTRQGHS